MATADSYQSTTALKGIFQKQWTLTIPKALKYARKNSASYSSNLDKNAKKLKSTHQSISNHVKFIYDETSTM